MRFPSYALTLVFSACIPQMDEPANITNLPDLAQSRYGRELGTLTAIYPIPREDGGYDLELQLTNDTVRVDFEEARVYASDSMGRALFRSTKEKFFTLNEHCLHNPKKDACLGFREFP